MTETRPLDIHLIAIGGTGMAPLACLLKDLGHRVRGSDGPLYPPTSDLLAEEGIEPMVGYDPSHLDPPPDLVIVGNAVPRDNPEVREMERRGLPRLSMPQALYRFFLADRRPLVVAGTHGKTTTTAMAARAYTACDRDVGYLVGGRPRDLPRSFAAGSHERFCVEGDEYNAAYFDRGPKFLHYRPETLVLTSVEYDHADLYPTPETFRGAFRKLVAGLPASGLLIACGDRSGVREIVGDAACRVLFYGLGEGNDVTVTGAPGPSGQVGLRGPESWRAELRLAVPGRHNLSNALAVWAAACSDGIDPSRAARALSRFRGVARRLEELGTVRGVTVIDDFAHHPTAVAAGLQALRDRYGGRRVVALFEPRSLTAGQSIHQEAYVEAFRPADVVWLAPIYYRERFSSEELLDRPRLAGELRGLGVEVRVVDSVEGLAEAAVAEAETGDVLVTMSSGSFGGLPRRLLRELGTDGTGPKGRDE
ncbi:MAG: Mur ligase family protein [Thermoanaerobaculia bacterium]|nr:Mur ligase family protein [Thermoanaerobaculia bacterium]